MNEGNFKQIGNSGYWISRPFSQANLIRVLASTLSTYKFGLSNDPNNLSQDELIKKIELVAEYGRKLNELHNLKEAIEK